MSAAPQFVRQEIIEERSNRDAFQLCVMILVVVGLGLIVLGILAWNSRIMLMPIVPRAVTPPAAPSAPRVLSAPTIQTAPRSSIARGVVFHAEPPPHLPTCRPVPVLPARGFCSSYPAKAMTPDLAPAQAAGLQSNLSRRHTAATHRLVYKTRLVERIVAVGAARAASGLFSPNAA